MENKIVSKFKSNPTDYYGMSIAASWAGVGSLMNSITMTHTYGLIPSMIWGFGNSTACIVFGLVACRLTTFRDHMGTGQGRHMDAAAPAGRDHVQPHPFLSRRDELSDLL